ncbi:MAG: bifunctional phosphopantothenoylcysteine decarboxylase/phosphopantothenate--cysteine ligase CoaBC [Hyphomicrobiales bacterium]|nr:bifunctional phosphopantothenoylcysteine decarboxylase/phosphopantothenate--cysteine ligase CoaBC [Hyphomicrobiales bacterium]
MPLKDRRILLIITGGIAAYKALILIRRLREKRAAVRAVMSSGAHNFLTPLSVSAVAGAPPLDDLFDPRDEHDVGHIRLSREADLIVVAPASADFMAKMANGLADDLASAVYLASDKPVMVAPAMNPMMWQHPATRRNMERLKDDGVAIIGPETGEMAESGEAGMGRMSEPEDIAKAIEVFLFGTETKTPLAGRSVLVTAGPTYEPIDPVRYIANRSSGRQGYAIAAVAARAGADVTLVSGPVSLPDPRGVNVIRIETARAMADAVEAALPADIAIMSAAVADWRVQMEGGEKIKKEQGAPPPSLSLVENPDILKTVARHQTHRPDIVVGFAAETEKVVEHAIAKRQRKGCDWIVANDVSPGTGIMGGSENAVHLITENGVEDWPRMDKEAVAVRLVTRLADCFAKQV